MSGRGFKTGILEGVRRKSWKNPSNFSSTHVLKERCSPTCYILRKSELAFASFQSFDLDAICYHNCQQLYWRHKCLKMLKAASSLLSTNVLLVFLYINVSFTLGGFSDIHDVKSKRPWMRCNEFILKVWFKRDIKFLSLAFDWSKWMKSTSISS